MDADKKSPAAQDAQEAAAVAGAAFEEARTDDAVAAEGKAAGPETARESTAAAAVEDEAIEKGIDADDDVLSEAVDAESTSDSDREHAGPEAAAVTLESIDARIAGLADLFKAKIEHSEYELEVARRYSEELQEYKGDLFRKITEPLLRGAVALAGGMRKAEDACIRREESTIPLETFSLYREELEDLLCDYGIASFTPQVGEPFVSGDHKIVGKGIPTDDPAQARTVAEVKGSGYRSGDGVLAPARVCVFVLEEGAASTEAAPEATLGAASDSTSVPDADDMAGTSAPIAMHDGPMAVEAAAAQAIPVPAPRTRQEESKPGIADTIPMPKIDR